MKTTDKIYEVLVRLEEKLKRGISAQEISDVLYADRANVSRYLNRLCEEKRVEKLEVRPVLFRAVRAEKAESIPAEAEYSFDRITGHLLHLRQHQRLAAWPKRGRQQAGAAQECHHYRLLYGRRCFGAAEADYRRKPAGRAWYRGNSHEHTE